MHHMVAYFGSVGIAADYTALPAVADQATNIQNSRYTFDSDRHIINAFVMSNGLSKARINAPALRVVQLPSISPFVVGVTVPNLPPVNFFGHQGPFVVKNDELGVDADNPTAGALNTFAGLWVEKVIRGAPAGPIFPTRCTASVVSAAGTWVNGPLTFEQSLPAGRYSVVGFEVRGANALFGRLIFPGQPERPGVVCQQAAGEQDWPDFRNGGMGELGQFDSYAPPQVEVLGFGATATQVVILDLIKIA